MEQIFIILILVLGVIVVFSGFFQMVRMFKRSDANYLATLGRGIGIIHKRKSHRRSISRKK